MNQQNKTFAINPETKVAALIEHFPQTEATLIELAPPFRKLKNPLLRRTIAKVTNLRQAAQVGNISLGALINALRFAAGIQEQYATETSQNEPVQHPPDWFDESRIEKNFDARKMIDAGGFPADIVMNELKTMQPDKIFELITAFLPAPLIELAQKKGFGVWSRNADNGLIKTYFAAN
ncbi:DUF1858 domain-containing protein [candidate division KSB1 bacterium]|nr:DUF1858 domain-containing protein [candidate division KSB1 bacterium]